MSPQAAVRCTVEGPVMTVTLSRPAQRNAVDGPTAALLREAFASFERDESLRVAVFTGDGGQFCAGADLTALGDPARANAIEPTGTAAGPMGPTRTQFSKPVIAAVEGYAVAGGLELALMCDLRVAARSAVFGVFCRRWGVPLIDGGTVRLPRLIGMGRALDLILTGRAVSADEALQMGLANRVVDDGQALAAAQALGGTDRGVPAALHAGRPRIGLCAVGPAAERRAAPRGRGRLPGGVRRRGRRRRALCRRRRTPRPIDCSRCKPPPRRRRSTASRSPIRRPASSTTPTRSTRGCARTIRCTRSATAVAADAL